MNNITFPVGLESIGYGAFKGCLAFKEIVIPNTVTNIESNLFNACKNIEQLYIPDSVEFIVASVFYGCNNLIINFKCSKAKDTWNPYWNNNGGKVVWNYKK